MKKEIKKIIDNVINEMIGYHSSAADFDKFELGKKKLNDHNNEAYGHGVYLDLESDESKRAYYGKNKYKCEIPDDPKLYLYNDRRLTLAMRRKAFNKLFRYLVTNKEYGYYDCQEELREQINCILNCEDGCELYGTINSFLGSSEDTSEFFVNQLGIIGLIHDINHDSDDIDEKHYNVVIFDPKYVKILEKS